MNNILIRGYEIKYERNFSNCVKKNLKNSGLEPTKQKQSAIPGLHPATNANRDASRESGLQNSQLSCKGSRNTAYQVTPQVVIRVDIVFF